MASIWHVAQELKNPAKREERMARIQELEDRVCDRAAGVVEAMLCFHEISPDQQEPPPEWVEAYGAEGARQKLAVAKAGWLPQSIAPNAGKLAAYIMTGIAKARGQQKVALNARHLNVKIQLPPPTSAAHPTATEAAYPEVEIE